MARLWVELAEPRYLAWRFLFFGYLTLLRTNLFKEIYCPALEAPFRGSITPSSCTDERANIRRTTVCTYGCETGHYVTGGDNSLTCQNDGLWQGTVPYCQRKYNSCLVTKGKLWREFYRSVSRVRAWLHEPGWSRSQGWLDLQGHISKTQQKCYFEIIRQWSQSV